MAKALFGHVGVGPDPRLLSEVVRLRHRITELEDEVSRLRAVNSALADHVQVHDDVLALTVPDAMEPIAMDPADPAPALA